MIKGYTEGGEELLLNLSEKEIKKIRIYFTECRKKGIEPKIFVKPKPKPNSLQVICGKILNKQVGSEYLPYLRAYYPNLKDDELTFDLMMNHRFKMTIKQGSKSDQAKKKAFLKKTSYKLANRNEALEQRFQHLFKFDELGV